jgi:hypothetical protein
MLEPLRHMNVSFKHSGARPEMSFTDTWQCQLFCVRRKTGYTSSVLFSYIKTA